MDKKILLNVGGGPDRDILPERYAGYEHQILDINPEVGADIVCDAKDLNIFDKYDAVYSSHTLEHFYKHEVAIVLGNMYNCLKKGGTIEIIVPDIKELILKLSKSTLDLHDVYYRTGAGIPVTYHDVLYGWDFAMSSGNLYFAHKCGFTDLSLKTCLHLAGFSGIEVSSNATNLFGRGIK